MEALLLLPVVIVGGVFFVIVMLAIARGVSGATGPGPSELGRAIGLTPQGRNDAVGDRDGIGVHARWTTVQRGSGKSRRTVRVMRYWAAFDPPLRMGLEIGREGMLDGFFDAIGVSGDVQVGDPELDGALRIAAIDAGHAAQVIRAPEVKHALLAGARYGTFGVSDARVATGHDRWATTPQEVQASIELVHAIARALRDVRARTPAGWEPQLAETWGAIARTESMQWMPERSRLATRAGDAWLTLDVLAEKGKLVTRLALRFDAPLGIGLDVYRTGLQSQLGALLGAQDVRCGNAAFDDAFTVKAKDAGAARAVLAGGGADAVLELLTVMPDVHVHDGGADAQIGTVLLDARQAGLVMRAGAALARALRGGGGAQAGAYR